MQIQAIAVGLVALAASLASAAPLLQPLQAGGDDASPLAPAVEPRARHKSDKDRESWSDKTFRKDRYLDDDSKRGSFYEKIGGGYNAGKGAAKKHGPGIAAGVYDAAKEVAKQKAKERLGE